MTVYIENLRKTAVELRDQIIEWIKLAGYNFSIKIKCICICTSKILKN